MTWIIDRIEDEFAVCEYCEGKTIDVPLASLPDGIKEGDVVTLTVSDSDTKMRKENINKLMNSLFVD